MIRIRNHKTILNNAVSKNLKDKTPTSSIENIPYLYCNAMKFVDQHSKNEHACKRMDFTIFD